MKIDESEENEEMLEILKKVSPGTALREALDDIVRARTGALIVVNKDGLSEIMDGGFLVDCDFTRQKLVELCKMDGAVILSDDLKKIWYANVLLVPSSEIKTEETGTRHKAAERAAKQIQTPVIAISERRHKITIYYKDKRYSLRSTEEILTRANQSLQILEKQRELYDGLISNLNFLEITDLVVVNDVCSVLQRIEMFKRIADSIKKSLVELGKEGSIVKIRLRELSRGIEKEKQTILKDYSIDDERKFIFDEIELDDLLNLENLAAVLFEAAPDSKIVPKGHRFLARFSLAEEKKEVIVSQVENLNNLLSCSNETLLQILENDAEVFIKEMSEIKEQFVRGKKI